MPGFPRYEPSLSRSGRTMLPWVVVVRRGFLAVVLVLAGALPAACGGSSVATGRPDCAELCQKGKDERCPGAELIQCEDNCLSEDARAETSGCRAAYDASLECTASLEDICTVAKACSDQVTDYLDCVADFCKDHSAEFCVP